MPKKNAQPLFTASRVLARHDPTESRSAEHVEIYFKINASLFTARMELGPVGATPADRRATRRGSRTEPPAAATADQALWHNTIYRLMLSERARKALDHPFQAPALRREALP